MESACESCALQRIRTADNEFIFVMHGDLMEFLQNTDEYTKSYLTVDKHHPNHPNFDKRDVSHHSAWWLNDLTLVEFKVIYDFQYQHA